MQFREAMDTCYESRSIHSLSKDKFPTLSEIKEVVGDQALAQQCNFILSKQVGNKKNSTRYPWLN